MTKHPFFLALGAAAVLTLAPAAAASATEVTNPADNPAPITVVVGGQTYTDGLDTLPGYDDIACTTIPDVSYDFGANEIHYPDGQVAHWTEWDRIPGYQVWLDQKSSASPKPTSSPKPSASPSASASASATATSGSTTASTGTSTSTASSGTKTATSGSKTSTTKTSTTKTTTKTPTKTSKPATTTQSTDTGKGTTEIDAPTSTASATSAPAPGDEESTAPEPTETSAAVVVDESTDAPSVEPVVAAAAPLDSSLTSSVDDVTGNTTGGGLAILVALTLSGAGLLGFQRMRSLRTARRAPAQTRH